MPARPRSTFSTKGAVTVYIPCCVDTFEPEPEIDVAAIQNETEEKRIAADASAPVFSVYTNAYAILLGVADERQRQRILERVRVSPTTGPPAEIVDRVIEPYFEDPFPDYDTEPVMLYANA